MEAKSRQPLTYFECASIYIYICSDELYVTFYTLYNIIYEYEYTTYARLWTKSIKLIIGTNTYCKHIFVWMFTVCACVVEVIQLKQPPIIWTNIFFRPFRNRVLNEIWIEIVWEVRVEGTINICVKLVEKSISSIEMLNAFGSIWHPGGSFGSGISG